MSIITYPIHEAMELRGDYIASTRGVLLAPTYANEAESVTIIQATQFLPFGIYVFGNSAVVNPPKDTTLVLPGRMTTFNINYAQRRQRNAAQKKIPRGGVLLMPDTNRPTMTKRTMYDADLMDIGITKRRATAFSPYNNATQIKTMKSEPPAFTNEQVQDISAKTNLLNEHGINTQEMNVNDLLEVSMEQLNESITQNTFNRPSTSQFSL
jgi:hypothetical protein